MEDKINICVLDFEDKDIQYLKNQEYNIYEGSAGTSIEIEHGSIYSEKFCLLNHNYPQNLHEYDILIINQNHKKKIPYDPQEHERTSITDELDVRLSIKHPTTIFDPKPYAYSILAEKLNQSLIICYADFHYEVVYNIKALEHGNHERLLDRYKFSNYAFLNISLSKTKYGKSVNILGINPNLRSLFQSFLNDIEYHQTFKAPRTFNERNENIPDPHFYPLLENKHQEIISYAYFYKNTSFFMFPDIKRKGEFTSRFLTEVAPDILTNLFNHNKNFKWLERAEYLVPNHQNLFNQKTQEIERHKAKILEIEKQMTENQQKHQFLHDLIIETGDKLVHVVAEFLKNVVGFDNVIEMDEKQEDGLFEEDIQIEINDKLLVIEVKGIGGTSKDSECSQISKIIKRRMKERKSTEVYGLYIVNHQRFKPPTSRENPPFNDNQIQDAQEDDRGLLTTWQLFQLYYYLETGIFTKEEVQKHLLDYGLINFKADWIKIGEVDKLYQDGKIGSLEIIENELNKDDEIIIEKNGKLTKQKICSMQQDKKDISLCSTGRVGIKVNSKKFKFQNKSIIWKK